VLLGYWQTDLINLIHKNITRLVQITKNSVTKPKLCASASGDTFSFTSARLLKGDVGVAALESHMQGLPDHVYLLD